MKVLGFGSAFLAWACAMAFFGGALLLVIFVAERAGPQPEVMRNGKWVTIPREDAVRKDEGGPRE